ncbi:glycosyltransferase [Candidatus Gottesmanbacteria bacterium]|nr:glycosyltransferase [Candidatus Gottesmanbacteria bacterium]
MIFFLVSDIICFVLLPQSPMFLKIAFISYWSCPLTKVGVLASGGMNIYVLSLANYLGKLGHKVDIYTRVHKENDEKILQTNKNVRIIHLAAANIKDTDFFSYKVQLFIKKSKLKYDILHTHYFYSGLIGLELRKRLAIPLLSTFHSLGKTKELYVGIRDAFRIDAEKKIVSKADGIIASTELEKSDLMESYKGEGKKIFVLSPGVNHHLFKPKNKVLSRLKLNLPLKPKTILFVGRIDPIKGISFLIEAIVKLTRQYRTFEKNYRVLLIGGDISSSIFWANSEVKKIKQMILSKNLECCIKFIGSRPHHLLPDYYSASDVLVAPSLYESFGLVVLEAMASGACVLVSRVGGLKYLVKDKVNGRFFENGDVISLSDILWKLLNNKKERLRLGSNAFVSSQRFCWDIQAKKMEDVYKRFL